MIGAVIDAYCHDVTSGKIAGCKWARLACQRHLDDRDRDDIFFDEEAAARASGFIETFRHYKGDFAGRRFLLMDWQKFIVGSIFGWKRKSDGKRKYKYAFIEIPRKNGKTFLAAGIGIYMLCADGEGGAEIYCTATKKDQAKRAWKDMQTLIQKSRNPSFISRFDIRKNPAEIEFPDSESFAVPLGRDKDGDTTDGLNPHLIIMDEIHAWKSFSYWNVLNSALGARSQPLILMVTTAGYVMNGVGKQQEKIAQNILEGIAEGDDYFAVIHTIDEGDDIEDPATWEKANPCYGVTVTEAKFRSQLNLANQNPALMREFKVKWLNVWIFQVQTWLKSESWKGCFVDIDPDDLRGLRCYGGLDLAQVYDLSAFVLLFPPQDGLDRWTILAKFWCPSENIVERSDTSGDPYHIWAEKGLITATPGNVTDYNFVERDIIDMVEPYDLQAIAFDRTFSGAIIQNLQDELGEDVLIQFAQGFMTISSPAKEIERQVIGEELNHLNNPILEWMAGNCVVQQDANGNIKPDKEKSESKIDGIVALIMARGLATEMEGEDEGFDDGLDSW